MGTAREIDTSLSKLYFGTDSEILDIVANEGDVGYSTSNTEYTYIDGTWVLSRGSINGATRVIQGATGVSQNRERIGVDGVRKKVSWVIGVTEVTVLVTSEVAGTSNLPAVLAVTFDANDAAAADLALTPSDSETNDSYLKKVTVGVPRTFYFTSPITRLDMKRLVGSETLHVSIEAI